MSFRTTPFNSCYSGRQYISLVHFDKSGEPDSRAQFLAVKVLFRELNRYVTPRIFTSYVSEPYENLRMAILKRQVLTDRQSLDQFVMA